MKPDCSREEEWEWIKRWQAGDDTVEPLLESAYKGWVQAQARRYAWCGLEEVILECCGWKGFWEAVEDFNLEYKNRLSTYATYKIADYCFSEARNALGISRNAFRIYNTLKHALNELDLHAEPRNVQLGELNAIVEEVHRQIRERDLKSFQDWSQNRIEDAVREILTGVPMSLDEESNAEEWDGAQVTMQPDPAAEAALARVLWRMDAPADVAAIFVCIQGKFGEIDGQKWFVLCVLHEIEDTTWPVLCEQLRMPHCTMTSHWPITHEEYVLPAAIPAEWTGIHELFATGAPRLKDPKSISQWYRRKKDALIKES